MCIRDSSYINSNKKLLVILRKNRPTKPLERDNKLKDKVDKVHNKFQNVIQLGGRFNSMEVIKHSIVV